MNYRIIWNELIKQTKITICTHIDPDGDTVGSAYALKHLLLEANKNIEIKISGAKPPKSLNSINEQEDVSDHFFNNSQIVVVDTSSAHRISDKRVITSEAINIDHHHDDSEFKMRIGGDHWPATGQVLYEMAKELELSINEKASKGMFYAIWTDTEAMTQRNISDITKEAINTLGINGIKEECLKSLELPEDIKLLINEIKQKLIIYKNITYVLSDIMVPFDYYRSIIAELSNGTSTEIFCSILKHNKNEFRGSLRSKGNVDISILAKSLGGGGHLSSSGFRCTSLDQAKKKLKYIIDKI